MFKGMMYSIVILLMVTSYVFGGDLILSCTQVDGTVMYTNKDSKGCTALRMPELSIVPDRKASFPSQATETISETPALIASSGRFSAGAPVAGSVFSEACNSYNEWVQMGQRTIGGLLFNTPEETRKWAILMKRFSSGFLPYGCQ